jgi:RHS repeat-associated protein
MKKYAFIISIILTLAANAFAAGADIAGGRISKTSGSYEIQYYITDHLGSTRVITDSNGEIKEQNDYYPFGMRHQNPNLATSTNRWLFSGKEKQTSGEINYMDFGSRMYDDFLGRWFTIDPRAEDYYPLSPYAYCGNNPVMYRDYNGEWFGLDDLIVAAVGFVVGYVSHGISTGHWGASALLSGAMGAAGAWLGFNTMGAGAKVGEYIASMGINAVANQIMPSMNIPIGNHFSISMGASFMMGSHGIGAGVTFGANYRIDLGDGYYTNLGFSMNASGSYASDYIGGGGSLFSYSGGIDIGRGDVGLSLYSTRYNASNGSSQTVGGIGIYAGEFSARYENDGVPFSGWLGDGGDRYRTAAVQVGWGDYSVGVNFYTGDPNSSKDVTTIHGDGRMQKGYYSGGNVDDYRLGALYVGYKNYRIGVNSEQIRHIGQNIFTHNGISPQRGFIRTSCDYKPYFYYGTKNRYSLW